MKVVAVTYLPYGRQHIRTVGTNRDEDEHAAQEQAPHRRRAAPTDELRQKGGKKQRRLGVQQGNQKAIAKRLELGGPTIKITPGPDVIARMKLASANMAKVGDMRC
jgi:hypothetical protein